MMKKMVSFVMTLVMATTLMVAVAPAAEVDAASTAPTTKVTYTSGVSTPNYTVTVPSGIAFSDNAKTNVEADVKLAAVNGANLGSLEVTIKVKSTNGYYLKHDSTSEEVDYNIVYGTSNTVTVDRNAQTAAAATNGVIEIGKVTASATTLDGNANLTATFTPTQTSGYSDILTYTITETAPIQAPTQGN